LPLPLEAEVQACDTFAMAVQQQQQLNALVSMQPPEIVLCRVVMSALHAGAVRVRLGMSHRASTAGAPLQWVDASANVAASGRAPSSHPADVLVLWDCVVSCHLVLGPSFALALLRQKRAAKTLLQQLPRKASVDAALTAATSTDKAAASTSSLSISDETLLAAASLQTSTEPAKAVPLVTVPSGSDIGPNAKAAAAPPQRRRHSKRYHKVAAQRSLGVGTFLAKLKKST
jgi:hypothetical protein